MNPRVELCAIPTTWVSVQTRFILCSLILQNKYSNRSQEPCAHFSVLGRDVGRGLLWLPPPHPSPHPNSDLCPFPPSSQAPLIPMKPLNI